MQTQGASQEQGGQGAGLPKLLQDGRSSSACRLQGLGSGGCSSRFSCECADCACEPTGQVSNLGPQPLQAGRAEEGPPVGHKCCTPG